MLLNELWQLLFCLYWAWNCLLKLHLLMWQSVLQKQGSCRRTWGIATHQNSAIEALYFAGLVKIRFSLILFIYYSLSITPCAYWDFSNISTGNFFFNPEETIRIIRTKLLCSQANTTDFTLSKMSACFDNCYWSESHLLCYNLSTSFQGDLCNIFTIIKILI